MNKNVTAVLLIVLAIGVYLTFTRAKLSEIKAIRFINDQYIAAIANADRLIKIRDQVLEDYNNISADDRARLDKMIPDTVDNIRLIIDLNSLGRAHGLLLRNIKAATTENSSTSKAPIPKTSAGQSRDNDISNPTLDTVTISFSTSASYQQFIDFMEAIESNLRIMDMSHLTVAANASGTYDFGVELKTYWLRQ